MPHIPAALPRSIFPPWPNAESRRRPPETRLHWTVLSGAPSAWTSFGQAEVIRSVLARKDTLAIMPTGAGKSLCYQLPALHLEGVTIIVSPLISLMKDQVDKLQELGLDALQLNSSLGRRTEAEAIADRERGK